MSEQELNAQEAAASPPGADEPGPEVADLPGAEVTEASEPDHAVAPEPSDEPASTPAGDGLGSLATDLGSGALVEAGHLDGDDLAAAARAEEEDDYEQLLEDLQRLHSEREDYLDQLLRTRADFENYRKRMLRQQGEVLERAGEDLVGKLLEVLDVFDAAVTHGQGFDQAYARLLAVLTKEGLARIEPVGAPFDPNEADAVGHEAGEDGPVVSEVLRPGYRWKGRVLRPAMVKVKG